MDERVIQTTRGEVRVRRARPEEVVDLRHAILRAGLPRETAIFPGDERPDALHLIALAADGRVVGCATAYSSTWDGTPAWQIRGMATDPSFRGYGIGRAMLLLLEDMLRNETPVRQIQMWCNARVPAIGFYERLGWHVVSEVFQNPVSGPHVRMTKRISGLSELILSKCDWTIPT